MATSKTEGQSLAQALRARPEIENLRLHILKGAPVDAVTPVYDAAQTELNALLLQFGLKAAWPTI